MVTHYEVELHGFGEQGREIRVVEVPHAEVEQAQYLDRAQRADIGRFGPHILGPIYHYGQNDFQAKPIRSVSVGDIIRLPGGDRWVVKGVGFAKVPAGWVTPTRAFQASTGRGGTVEVRTVEIESRWGLDG